MNKMESEQFEFEQPDQYNQPDQYDQDDQYDWMPWNKQLDGCLFFHNQGPHRDDGYNLSFYSWIDDNF